MRRIRKLLGLVAVIAIVSSVAACGKTGGNAGKVLFTTDLSPLGQGEGKMTCKIDSTVTSIKAGNSFYSVYFWTHRLTDKDVVHEEDFKDGVSFFTDDWSPNDTKNVDCTFVTNDLAEQFTEPGEYKIVLTVADKVVAEGSITVTE